jgi:hypothetical protein
MTNHAADLRRFVVAHPPPTDDPVSRLRHVVDVMEIKPDDATMLVQATSNVYDLGIRTGLTRGDLVALLDIIDEDERRRS